MADDGDGEARVGQWQVVVSTITDGERDVRQMCGQMAEMGEIGDGVIRPGDEFDGDIDVCQALGSFGSGEHLVERL